MPDAKETEQQGLAESKRYKVTGGAEVLGHAPGSTFEATLSEEQEKLLLDSGALSKAAGNAKLSEEEPTLTAAARAQQLAPIPETAEAAADLEPSAPVPATEPEE